MEHSGQAVRRIRKLCHLAEQHKKSHGLPNTRKRVQRLNTLRGYGILDTHPEDRFDDLAWLAASICGAPISKISLVDEDRQWFKSKIGLEMCQTSRVDAFCAHAIMSPELFVIPDASLDPRFAANPLVVGEPHIRFYAGAPLVAPDGHILGALCVLDRCPANLARPIGILAHPESTGNGTSDIGKESARLEDRLAGERGLGAGHGGIDPRLAGINEAEAGIEPSEGVESKENVLQAALRIAKLAPSEGFSIGKLTKAPDGRSSLPDGYLTPGFPKTPPKTSLFSKATPISSNDCNGLTGKKCKITNLYRGPDRLTGPGGYIPLARSASARAYCSPRHPRKPTEAHATNVGQSQHETRKPGSFE